MAHRKSSYWIRRARRHLLLGGVSAALVALVYVAARSDDPVFSLSLATGHTALFLVVGTLLVGPLNVLRQRPNPVSTDMRRDIGIWAGMLALVHVVFGLQVHLGGVIWKYFLFELPGPRSLFPFRRDLFGFANYTGLAATLVLSMLLALSNDLSLRKLGTRRWKSLQRWNYLGFGCTVLHGIAYQLLERRQLVFVAVLGIAVLAAVAFQLAGARRAMRNAR